MVLSGAAALFMGPAVQAAETVTMGSDAEPNEFKFFPAEITVPVGSTVVWRNLSDIPHDTTAKDNSFGSEQLAKGQDFSFTFKTPGEVAYYCSVPGHEGAGMKGLIKVTGAGGGTPTTATTPTTQGGPATTAATGASTTTTAAAAPGGSSTTTTTAAAGGATTTTLAPGVTPTSAPEAAETTTTTAAAHGTGEEAAADDHSSEGGQEKSKKKNSPIGIAFASVSTVLLAGIAGKMLASKS
jgi:plastocyanin